MAYFDQDFLDFYRELAQNNHKQWFDANRKRYDQVVKKPFQAFVSDLIQQMRFFEPDLYIEPRDAVFRVNRDIRFAKDKSPYKTHSAANVAPGGRKDEKPGFYIHFGAQEVILGGGCYWLSTQRLQAVRELIADQLPEFQNTIQEDGFKSYWGQVEGTQNKRLPKDFKSIYEEEPLIANKQFYTWRSLSPELVLRDDLMDVVMAFYMALKPLNDFLKQAFEEG
jgi:uncharacterized protein (TIGR02453 family)